jgi:hypothetical protein
MIPGMRLMVEAMMTRDLAELTVLRDGAFDLAASKTGQGTLVSSSINGSSFSFSLPGAATLTPLQVVMLAQTAIDHKRAGFCRPTTKTTVRFI